MYHEREGHNLFRLDWSIGLQRPLLLSAEHARVHSQAYVRAHAACGASAGTAQSPLLWYGGSDSQNVYSWLSARASSRRAWSPYPERRRRRTNNPRSLLLAAPPAASPIRAADKDRRRTGCQLQAGSSAARGVGNCL